MERVNQNHQNLISKFNDGNTSIKEDLKLTKETNERLQTTIMDLQNLMEHQTKVNKQNDLIINDLRIQKQESESKNEKDHSIIFITK